MSDFAEQFEDLRIWQEARVQAGDVYRDFGSDSPGARDFGFRDQIQRAAVSVMNNIAEGFERHSPKEFAHLPGVAKGSCGEICSMLYLAEDLGYINPDLANERRQRSLGLSRGIEALNKKLRAN
ncbi:MAG: four helix bundle protein [Verrucomicrobiales bacterium]|nr:four helix bundle protein [Verrucomicrobiales bacterium]